LLKGVTKIDILHLIDRLEELVDRGFRLPLGNKVAIDEDMFLNIIDQMRITIPQEIKLAKEIQRERDKYVAQAHEEAQRIIVQAREDAAKELDEHKLRKAAETQAAEIVKRAQQEAAQIRTGADDYAETKLRQLGQSLGQLQAIIQNGIEALQSQRDQQKETAATDSVAGASANRGGGSVGGHTSVADGPGQP
jgi:vacuolar-type H+-ATPase subunit H